MKFRELERDEAQKLYESLADGVIKIDDAYFADLDDSYSKIRKTILAWIADHPVAKNYDFDLSFALELYSYFSPAKMPGFNESVASNYGFWRYVCLKVIPDIIIERHGFVKEYFYAKNVRLYASTLWWYIEMCYQGSLEKTYDCLKDKSTDYILQIVERPGRDGMYLDVSRLIVHYLSVLPSDIVNKEVGGQTLLRRILIQNTARSSNYNMVLDNKADEYVKGLLLSCGVEVEKYEHQ